MTPADFRATSIAALGTAVGWQSEIARRLGVTARMVRYWMAGDRPIPDDMEARLAEIIGAADLRSPFPRDKWLIGDAFGGDGRRREYIAHLQAPRFVARIVMVDEDGLPLAGEEPADTLSGVVWSSDDYLICEIAWIDEPPPARIAALLEAASDAIEKEGPTP